MNDIIPFGILLKAIQNVETGHLSDATNAPGDDGKALGPMQIHRGAHQDAMEMAFPNWSKKYWPPYRLVGYDTFAQVVFFLYMKRYARTSLDKMDVENCLKMARIWNGGPTGHRKKATKGYAYKVLYEIATLMNFKADWIQDNAVKYIGQEI